MIDDKRWGHTDVSNENLWLRIKGADTQMHVTQIYDRW